MEIINLVIADKDEMFLNKISKFIIEKNLGFDVSCFTEKESLLEHLNDEDINLLLVDEMFCNKDFIASARADVKIILTAKKNFTFDNWYSVKKYQKSDDFIKDIINIYYDAPKEIVLDKGSIEDVEEVSINTKVDAFYSPTGGSGTTTLSLAYACDSTLDGDQVFYINFENIDSSLAYLSSEKVISYEDIEEILNNEDFSNYEKIDLLSTKDDKTGISFFSFNLKNKSEYILTLIDIIKKCNIYKYVVLDIENYEYMCENGIVDICDNIYFIVNDGLLSRKKTDCFLKDVTNIRAKFILNNSVDEIHNKDHNNIIEYKGVIPYLQNVCNEIDLEKLSNILNQYILKLKK